jgi:hypothetical protein
MTAPMTPEQLIERAERLNWWSTRIAVVAWIITALTIIRIVWKLWP